MKSILLFFLSLPISICLSAQKKGQDYIDSLVSGLSRAKHDTAKTITYLNIAQAYVPIDPGIAMKYADTGMAQAKAMQWEKGITKFHIIRGNILSDKGQGNEALKEYQQALEVSRSLKDKAETAVALNDIGGVYFRKSDYVNAMQYYSDALKIAEELNDANMMGTGYTNFSTIYFAQQDFDKGISYAKKSLEQYERINATDKIARSLNYMGNSYMQNGNREQAEKYYQRALDIYQQTNNQTGIAILYSQIAILFDPDYRKIISYQERSQAIWDSINPAHYNSVINLGNMGESYLNIVRADTLKKLTSQERTMLLDKAEHYLNRSIQYSRETNDMDNLGYFSELLAQQQEIKGNYKAAIQNYRLSYAIRDSIFSQASKNKIAALESQREIDLRDKQIEVNNLALAAGRKTRIAMIAGLALLLIIGLLLFWQSKTRQRMNKTLRLLNNHLEEANKLKARFFAILSHDLRSPVASLISFLELQSEEPSIMTSEQASRHKRTIRESAQSLLETMEAMLIWSKEQMESFKPQIKPVTVTALFEHIQRFFPGQHMEFLMKEPLTVNTDPQYLQTIMQNLTANAIKATSDQAHPEIKWEAVQQGQQIILTLPDNGPGMNERLLEELVEGKTMANGISGFGLHLVRDLAKAIGCGIKINSDKERGTRFTLIMPG